MEFPIADIAKFKGLILFHKRSSLELELLLESTLEELELSILLEELLDELELYNSELLEELELLKLYNSELELELKTLLEELELLELEEDDEELELEEELEFMQSNTTVEGYLVANPSQTTVPVKLLEFLSERVIVPANEDCPIATKSALLEFLYTLTCCSDVALKKSKEIYNLHSSLFPSLIPENVQVVKCAQDDPIQ